MQASAAIPGRFDPVLIRGRLYADADLHAPMPVRWNWVRLTREYRETTARIAYDYTMARRREIEKVAA